MSNKIMLTECPRDAMQGWEHFIPTQKKIDYLNALLQVGFNTLDFGSFVSPKAIPQMADTKDVINKLNLTNTQTKLLAIIANERGATDALAFEKISILGFPFSISETFQQRNTNSSINESLKRVEIIQTLCQKKNKQLVVYISMGFGNPYGNAFNEEIVFDWINKLINLEINNISLADTVGIATPNQINKIVKPLIQKLPKVNIGVHLHGTNLNWKPKVEAALQAGCSWFDGALKGIGGCPMAGNELVGNIDTSLMIPFFEKQNYTTQINHKELQKCLKLADEIFV